MDELKGRTRWWTIDFAGAHLYPDLRTKKENEFIEEVETGNFYIYEDLKSILGVLHLTSKLNTLWNGRGENAFYTSKIAIKRNQANKQIGSRMLQKVEELAQFEGTTRIRLDCVSNNAKLKNYYEKQGFRFIERKALPEVTLDLYEKQLTSEGSGGND